MTHGCLKIIAEGERRAVYLHTYHTAMDTPQWIQEAPAFFAKHRASFLVEIAIAKKLTKPEIRRQLRNIHRGQFEYAPSVAAMIIACRPDCYEPVPPGFEADLPTWSGWEAPDILTVSEKKWQLTTRWLPPAEKTVISIDPLRVALNWLWAEVRKQKKKTTYET